MRAGRLRHRVVIQQPSGAQDETGAESGWSNVATVWASVEPGGAREVLEADAIRPTISHKVRIRYRSDVDATMRLTGGSLGSRILAITGIVDVWEIGRELILTCEETI